MMDRVRKCIDRDGVNILLCFFLLVFFMSTWKYVKDGDAYFFQTPTADNYVDLMGNVVTEEILVDETADWSDKSYSVYFHFAGQTDRNGKVEISLSKDDKVIDSFSLPIDWISEGFNALKWLDFSSLSAGRYKVSIGGSTSQNLCVGLCENIYNLPNCYVNGTDTGYTLAQIYHFNYSDGPYLVGIILYFVLIGLSVITFRLCAARHEAASGVLRFTLIASYIIMAYEYDNGQFYQPLVCEAVTNFMHNSITQSWWKCLPIADAGYLPFVQRMISILVFNFLNISPYVGVYVLQFAAYILTGIVISFFAKRQFASVLDIRLRWIISMILMMTVLKSESWYQSTYFINFIVFGVYVFFLYFLVDSKEWSKWEFLFICAWVFAQSLSKGINVTLLPFCILCMILFHKTYSKRDVIVLSSCALGAFLQCVYYFAYGMQHSWSYYAVSADGEYYYAKLLLGILVDTPNWLLSPLGDKVTMLNGISMIIIILFWVAIAYIFIKEAALKICKGEAVKRESCVFLMAVIFIMAQSLFLRLMVSGWGNTKQLASEDFWSFQNFGNYDRHTTTIFLAVMLAYIVFLKVLKSRMGGRKYLNTWIIILITVCIVNPRMQVKGFWDDEYSRASSIQANNNSEALLLDGINETECRVVPMLHDTWIYKKNALCYCFGQDVLGWQGRGATVFDSGQPQKGSFAYPRSLGVDTNVPIYQVFVCKNCLVGVNKWQAILYDDQGNVLHRQEQDNTEYQKIASFTFDEGIPGVGRIQIVDSEGGPVRMENAMYVVTKAGEPLVR